MNSGAWGVDEFVFPKKIQKRFNLHVAPAQHK
jgi:hypothetical protein